MPPTPGKVLSEARDAEVLIDPEEQVTRKLMSHAFIQTDQSLFCVVANVLLLTADLSARGVED